MQFIASSNGQIKVSENPVYLPADLIASPASTMLHSTADEEVNNPLYLGVTLPAPALGNSTYDTLSGSQDNLLENVERPDQDNLYILDPANPIPVMDYVDSDAVDLAKKTFPQIDDEENPYETIPGTRNNAPYENVPPPPLPRGTRAHSGTGPYENVSTMPNRKSQTHSETVQYGNTASNTSQGMYDFIK